MYENIPDELKRLKNWVCWSAVPDGKREGKIKKLPVNPYSGGGAQSNNPDTWSDFDTAVRAAERFTGIGFMFGGCEYFGVDIDGVEDEIREYLDGGSGIVSEFVNTLQSYTELSQSRKGIHIICKGTLPKTGRRKGNVEMYEDGRFFVMTGDCISEFADIEDCTERIRPLHEKYIGGGREPAPVCKPVQTSIPTTASEILEAARKSKNGDKFALLYSGDYSGYSSQSEADMALCNMLAFWCRRDGELMDALFRQSGLMRDKWDRKQSGSTYGALTIAKAIAECTNVYEPKSAYKLSVGSEGAVDILPKLYSFDDTGNAQRFVEMFAEDMKYNYTDKCWLYWDGRRWATDSGGVIARAVDSSIESMSAELEYYEKQEDDTAKQFAKHIKYSRSHKGKKACEAQAQHRMPIMPHQLDKHKMAFNTPNGVLTLKTGELISHDAKWLITKLANVEYTEHADCPQWLKFLDEIFGGDKDLIRYVQKAVGYSLTGRTDEQCAFFLFGTGRNGKSTFLDVIRDIVGDYAMNIQPETLMVRSSQSSSINSDIARLKGARLVTSVEPNEGVRINEGLLKQLTGDDTVTARRLYGNEFEFKPEFKLWMATNHKPIIRGTDTGIWRRIHMIPFTVQIPPEKVDRQLKDKLRSEYSAILHWAVEGCILWQREGLSMPKAVLAMVREYRREMDVISAFLEDRCEELDYASAQATHLYTAYSSWCDANNEYKMSNTKFGIEMAKRFNKQHTKDGWFYVGVRLLS